MERGIGWKYLNDRIFKIICLIVYTIFRLSRNVRNRIKGLSVTRSVRLEIQIAAEVLIFSGYLLLAVV